MDKPSSKPSRARSAALAAIMAGTLFTLPPGVAGTALDSTPEVSEVVGAAGAEASSDCADLLGINLVCAEVDIRATHLGCQFFGPPSNVWWCRWRFDYSGSAHSPVGLPGVFEITGTADGFTGSNAICLIPCSGSGSVEGLKIIPQGQTYTVHGSTHGVACAPTLFFTPIDGVSTCVVVDDATSLRLI